MSQNNYYSGGGFMLNVSSPTTFGTSGGQKREGIAHSLRPVTVKQISKATQAHADAEWHIDGIECGPVCLVGQVVQISKQATNIVYTIDDGTGRIEARHWVTSSSSDDQEPDDTVGDIRENATFARVTGLLKHFGNKRYLNAQSVKAVQHYHEILFHILDTMYTGLVLERGMPNAQTSAGRQPTGHDRIGPSAYSAQSVAPVVRANDPEMPPVARKLLEIVAAAGEEGDGVHVTQLAKAIGGDATLISEGLTYLMDHGYIFNSLDDDWFKIT